MASNPERNFGFTGVTPLATSPIFPAERETFVVFFHALREEYLTPFIALAKQKQNKTNTNKKQANEQKQPDEIPKDQNPLS